MGFFQQPGWKSLIPVSCHFFATFHPRTRTHDAIPSCATPTLGPNLSNVDCIIFIQPIFPARFYFSPFQFHFWEEARKRLISLFKSMRHKMQIDGFDLLVSFLFCFLPFWQSAQFLNPAMNGSEQNRFRTDYLE